MRSWFSLLPPHQQHRDLEMGAGVRSSRVILLFLPAERENSSHSSLLPGGLLSPWGCRSCQLQHGLPLGQLGVGSSRAAGGCVLHGAPRDSSLTMVFTRAAGKSLLPPFPPSALTWLSAELFLSGISLLSPAEVAGFFVSMSKYLCPEALPGLMGSALVHLRASWNWLCGTWGKLFSEGVPTAPQLPQPGHTKPAPLCVCTVEFLGSWEV